MPFLKNRLLYLYIKYYQLETATERVLFVLRHGSASCELRLDVSIALFLYTAATQARLYPYQPDDTIHNNSGHRLLGIEKKRKARKNKREMERMKQ